MIRNAFMIAAVVVGFVAVSGCDYRPWPPIEDAPNIPGTCDEMAPFGGELCAQPMDNLGGTLRIRFEPDEGNWTEFRPSIFWASRSQSGNQWLAFDQNGESIHPHVYGGDSSGATFWLTMPMAPPDGKVEIEGTIHSEAAGFSDIVFCDNDPGGQIQVWFGPYYELDYRLTNDCQLVIDLSDLRN